MGNAGEERLEKYAELAVRVGANVQPGQETIVLSLVEHAPLARALTRQAYRAGASYVHVLYGDDHVRRAMIELGPDEALSYAPEWRKVRRRPRRVRRCSRPPARPSRSCSPTSTASASAARA